MFSGKLHIAGHNTELIEEMRHYHRDDDYRIVKHNEDMVSAFRYAVMMRHHGRPLSECDGIPYAGQRRERSREPQMAKGLDFDLFTGR